MNQLPLVSICIPTYNRIHCLNNCLNAIYISKKNFDHEFEVCISDNCSTEDVEKVINVYKDKINIKFKKNKENIGLGKNVLEAVSMAKGDYAWILGNDDFILPNTLEKLYQLVLKQAEKNKDKEHEMKEEIVTDIEIDSQPLLQI